MAYLNKFGVPFHVGVQFPLRSPQSQRRSETAGVGRREERQVHQIFYTLRTGVSQGLARLLRRFYIQRSSSGFSVIGSVIYHDMGPAERRIWLAGNFLAGLHWKRHRAFSCSFPNDLFFKHQ